MSNSLDPDQADILSGLIWVQTVCKSCQQMTLGDKDVTSAPDHMCHIARSGVHFYDLIILRQAPAQLHRLASLENVGRTSVSITLGFITTSMKQ